MNIRPTNLGSTDAIVAQIMSKQSNIINAQNQLISGKKINKPSDDAVGTSKILNIKKQQSQVATYLDNIKSAREQLNMVDAGLDKVIENTQKAFDLTMQASNGTNSREQLLAIKAEIDQIKDSIIDMANTQYKDQYLYSGANTAYKTFVTEADGSVTYQGSKDKNEMSRSMEILDEVHIPLSINGDEVFGSYTAGPPASGTGIIGALSELSTALGENPPDSDKIASYLDPIKASITSVTTTRTELAGYNGTRLDMTEAYLKDMELNLVDRRSSIEDVDIVEAVTNLSNQNYAYQASLAIASQNMSTSLLNYI